MLTYSAGVTLYLACVGLSGGLTGILLWPAVGLHVILTSLLLEAWLKKRKNSNNQAGLKVSE
jgi:hypothetical protein